MSSSLSARESAPSETLPQAATVLHVDGMKCAGCVSAVENRLRQQQGVANAVVNLVTQAAAVEYDQTQVQPTELAELLTASGFPSHPRQGQVDWIDRQEEELEGQWRQVAIAVCLLIFSTLGHLHHLGLPALPVVSVVWFHLALATLTLIGPARPIVQDGWASVSHGRPNMNTLVSLGALSAYGTSLAALVFPQLGWQCFFDEPVMLLSFILLGRTLEARARFRASKALRGLVSLQPRLASLVIGQTDTVAVPVSQVRPGDRLQVLAGDKIPVDAQIERGQTTVSEAMLTGESLPIPKQPGDSVIGGTLNQSGVVTICATRTGTDSTLAQMIQLVETAQTRKAPIQGLADTLSGYFTYGILTLAAATFGFWYILGLSLWPQVGHVATMGHHMAQPVASSPLLISLKLAISVVVVACPCALGLATPMAILVGSGIGAQRGLLVRGGDVLETAHRLDTLVFDKTGTLTTGTPAVTDCLSLVPDLGENELLTLAASLEQAARHPLGEAIVAAARQRQLTLGDPSELSVTPGLGLVGSLEQDTLLVGNAAWLHQHQIDTEAARTASAALVSQQKTPVYVARNHHLIGILGLADSPRPEAAAVIAQLRQRDLQLRLLSGDRPAIVSGLAAQLGITEFEATMTPAAKADAVKELQRQGRRVGFVGDGINDAPALAQADVGIALHSGTDIAMETADIILMRDSLEDLLSALDLSHATFQKIRQNLAWAFTYNLVAIPLAAGVLLPRFGIMLSPGVAGGLMAFSSISVVLNSLLLRWQLQADKAPA